MKRLELITAGIMLILAVVIVLATGDLTYWSGLSPGNRFVPLWVAGVSAVLALLLLREALLRKEDEPIDWPDAGGMLRVGGTYVAICALPTVVTWLGFVIGSAIFVLVILLALLRRRLLPSLLAMAVTTGTIYIVFISWLSIPLPKGVFGI